MKQCSIVGCEKSVLARTFCRAHYLRWWKHGDTNPKAPIRMSTGKGVPYQYMIDHMWDECPKWPFQRDMGGRARIAIGPRHAAVVHRIVCEIVNGPPPTEEYDAAHSCGMGHEGCFGARCLRWATRKENVIDTIIHERHPFARLNGASVSEIRSTKRRGAIYKDLAKQYDVSIQTIGDIVRRRTWKHVP